MTQRNRGPEVKADLVCPWNFFILSYSQMANYFTPSEKVDFFFFPPMLPQEKKNNSLGKHHFKFRLFISSFTWVCAFQLRCFMLIDGLVFFFFLIVEWNLILKPLLWLKVLLREEKISRFSSCSTWKVCWVCMEGAPARARDRTESIHHLLFVLVKWLHLKLKKNLFLNNIK